MEEILNNWLQEKPRDKFDKELNKYTYYDLMEFAEHYHTLQLQKTGFLPCFFYGQIITDGVYEAKVIEATTFTCSTMVKYLHNDIFDNISGIGWKLK